MRIRKIFDWLLFAPALLPLIYVDGLLFPYLTPKTLLLRALGIVASALFAYLSVAGTPFFWQRLRAKIAWIPGVLLAVAYVTSALGVDFYTSFWSLFARGDGLLTLTALVVFFYLILLSADKTFFATLYKVVAWVGSLVAVHATLQWFEALGHFSIPLIAGTGDRLGGTLGNPAFLASYLGLSIFATLFAAHISAKPYKIVLYAGAALQLLVIVLTATRGSILALAVMGVLALVYVGVKGSAQIKMYARGGLVALVIIAGLFFTFRSQLSHSPIAPVARIASVSLRDPTVSSRLFLWQSLTKEALPHALTGVGAEHIAILFDRVYNPDLIGEEWFDRSHNSFLDYFIQFGIFGFLLYGALVAFCGYTGWRLFARGEKDRLYGLALVAITGVYAVQNFFVFDTAVVLWLLLALFAAALAESDVSSPVSFNPNKGKGLGLGAGVILALLLWPVFIQPLRANIYLADAYLYHVADAARSVDSMQKGLALNTYADLEYGYEAYQMYTNEQLTQLSGTERVEAYQNTEAILEKNFARYPYDARTATYFAHVLDTTPPGAPAPAADLLPRVLAKAIELSPDRSQLWYIKANIFIQEGDSAKTTSVKIKAYTQAIDVLKEYAAQVSTLAEPRYVIATLYLTMGDKATAKKWADEALALYKKNVTTAGRAVKYYLAVEDWPHMAKFLEDIVDENPADYGSMYDLAKASYLAGNKARAIELVAQLRQTKPGYVETDPAFLKALGQ
jgi:O-antigen ligase